MDLNWKRPIAWRGEKFPSLSAHTQRRQWKLSFEASFVASIPPFNLNLAKNCQTSLTFRSSFDEQQQQHMHGVLKGNILHSSPPCIIIIHAKGITYWTCMMMRMFSFSHGSCYTALFFLFSANENPFEMRSASNFLKKQSRQVVSGEGGEDFSDILIIIHKRS